MTKIEDACAVREWQRRFEAELARGDVQTLIAHVRSHGHELFGQLQIVDLVGQQLEHMTMTEELRELVDDLTRAVTALKAATSTLFGDLPRPPVPDGAAVAEAVAAALARVRPAISGVIDVRLETATAIACCPRDHLEHLVVGLLLDVADAPRIDLVVRSRMIDDEPWVEIIRRAAASPGDQDDREELRVVERIALRYGGEVSSERRDGEAELVIALRAQ